MTGPDAVVLLRARTVLVASGVPVIRDGAVVMHGRSVVAVGHYSELRGSAEHEVDAGELLMPGMVDAHSHLRGIPLSEHGISPRSLEAWICSLSAMTPLSSEAEAAIASVELLETGITAVQGFVDAGVDAEATLHSAALIEAGVMAAGIRALLVLGHADRAVLAPEPAEGNWTLVAADAQTMDAVAFAAVAAEWLESRAERPEDLVRWGIGPVGAPWSTDAALAAIALLAKSRRIHTHLNESQRQREWLRGQPAPVERLMRHDLFNHRLTAAHCVHLTDSEVDAAAAASVTLVHCPTSNRALSVGRASVARWLRGGVVAAIGIDSQNVRPPDVFEVMRDALATAEELDDPLSPEQVLTMATTGGGAAIGVPGVGRLAPGSPADVVALDRFIASTEPHEFAAELIESGSADSVHSVWIAGQQRVGDGKGVLDVTGERQRLRAQLNADQSARYQRLLGLKPMIDAVERATR